MSTETELIWQKADAVCFDVDSTVITSEGIDELAAICGVGERVKARTKKAMGGMISFHKALSERLNICKPTKQQVERLANDNQRLQLTPGISELVEKLHKKRVPVYLVSGGFQQLLAPVAAKLSIPSENVFANILLFSERGEYMGFDESQPTSRSGGKKNVIETLKKQFGYERLVMIGDGATDLEACPPAVSQSNHNFSTKLKSLCCKDITLDVCYNFFL
jgi:phosphoserine phosphatase